MTSGIGRVNPKGRLLQTLLRCPILLYHAHLGWLLGDRFLRLTQRGRTSGRLRIPLAL